MTSAKRKAGEAELERKGKKPRSDPESTTPSVSDIDEAKIDSFVTAWKVGGVDTTRSTRFRIEAITEAINSVAYIQRQIEVFNERQKTKEETIDIWTFSPLARDVSGQPLPNVFEITNINSSANIFSKSVTLDHLVSWIHAISYRLLPVRWMLVFGSKRNWNDLFDAIQKDKNLNIPRVKYQSYPDSHTIVTLFDHGAFWEKFPAESEGRAEVLERLQTLLTARSDVYDFRHNAIGTIAKIPLIAQALVVSLSSNRLLRAEQFGQTWSVERPPRELDTLRTFFATHYFKPESTVLKRGMEKLDAAEAQQLIRTIKEMPDETDEDKRARDQEHVRLTEQHLHKKQTRAQQLLEADAKRTESEIALPKVLVLSDELKLSLAGIRRSAHQIKHSVLATSQSDYFPVNDVIVLEPPAARTPLATHYPLSAKPNHLRSPVPLFLYDALLAFVRSVGENKRSDTLAVSEDVPRTTVLKFKQSINNVAVLMATAALCDIFDIWTESTVLTWAHMVMLTVSRDFPVESWSLGIPSADEEEGLETDLEDETKTNQDLALRRALLWESETRAREICRWVKEERNEAKNGVMQWTGMPSSSNVEGKDSSAVAMDVSTAVNAGNTSDDFVT